MPATDRDAATVPPRRWLDAEQAAQYLRLSPHTLEKLRRDGTGPRFFRLGGRRRVVYDIPDLDSWVVAQGRVGGAPEVAP